MKWKELYTEEKVSMLQPVRYVESLCLGVIQERLKSAAENVKT